MNARLPIWLVFPLLAACGRPFDIETPRRFVELEEESFDYDYRATTADGVVIGVRAIDVDSDRGGDLSFWAEAVTQRMRQVGGYALVESNDLRARSGLRGKQLRFGRQEGVRPYRYWVTLLLDDDHLFVVESGGVEPAFRRAQGQVEAAIRSLRP